MSAGSRLEKLRPLVSESDVDAFLVTKLSNVRYAAGVETQLDEGFEGVFLLAGDVAELWTDFRYTEEVGIALEGAPVSIHIMKESLYSEVCDRLVELGVSSIALESSVPYGRFKYVSERFEGRVEVVDQWVERLRMVKTDEEVERISQAAALTDKGFEYIVSRIEPGRTEREIGLDLEVFLRSNGSEGVAFAPIVASGPNSARPHATVSDRQVGRGDFVKLDFGARVDGMCSDMTRTLVVGPASDRQREIHDAVLAANQAAIAAVRPGMSGRDLDAVARDLLDARGMGDLFGHGLGHGVGIDVHEMPAVNRRNQESIPKGAVITIEPGVYEEGLGGVRIEDLLVVDSDGARVLSSAPRHLIEL